MIELLQRRSSGHPSVTVVRIDFDIWDRVLAARPGWKLETISRACDRADAELMFCQVAEHTKTT
jgi:hypothetical protein